MVSWKLKLEEYDYKIIYKKVKQYRNANALTKIKINALENESLVVNIGDLDQEIENIINNTTLNDEERENLDNIINPLDEKDTLSILAPKILSLT